MKKSIRFLIMALTALLLLSTCACSKNSGITIYETIAPGNTFTVGNGITYLSAKTGAERDASTTISDDNITAAAEFALELMKMSGKDKTNELISPLSVMIALGMVTNGAWGETRAELEETLGMSSDELNAFINSFVQSLKNSDKASLVSANSVWVSNDSGLEVREDFIENIVRHYSAEIVSAPFRDEETLKSLNNWVSERTKGRIKEILEKFNDDDVMVLINALTFDANWEDQFPEAKDGSFTNADGSTCTAKMMKGDVSSYIKGGNCVGFKKDYAGGAYSYVALLPDKGMSIDKFISSLDGRDFLRLVNDTDDIIVHITIPKYSFDFKLEMNDVLKSMGVKLALDDAMADFSALSTTPLYISRVIHKTHIEVDESGTRAAAATAVVMTIKGGLIIEKSKTVTLDRPFVYAIIDNATGLPLFLGAVENLG